MTKIAFYGDVHGNWEELNEALESNPDAQHHIQAGDFGVFNEKDLPPDKFFKKQFFFIRGNHDNPLLLADLPNTEIVFNALYVQDSIHMAFGDVKINFLGGGNSIDKHRRVPYVSWWPEEMPDHATVARFAELRPADVWVTHVAPESVATKVMGHEGTSDLLSKNFDRICELIGAPKVWVFGHYHVPFDEVINGTRFICVPAVHDIDGITQKACSGITLDL